ncbi:hypothetical protein HYT59_01320 [Candidatus Woesebacteria bacterium]|nr:hypothetical protein [Candidatus Woesebacteria bacterium]
MQTIRTTITLRKDIYKSLKNEALDKDKSLNELLNDKISTSLNVGKAEIAKRKKALKRIKEIAREIDFSGMDFKELVNYGRKY